jgi:hypothetical protein
MRSSLKIRFTFHTCVVNLVIQNQFIFNAVKVDIGLNMESFCLSVI